MLDALLDWMNLPDDLKQRSFANYHIPVSHEPHPAKIEAYQVRLDEVVDQVNGEAFCYPFAHAYPPAPQWERMVAMIGDSRVDGMWVQGYGYKIHICSTHGKNAGLKINRRREKYQILLFA